MVRPLVELIAESLARPEADRWELVSELMDSLPRDEGAFGPDTPGYDEELQRRIDDLRSGAVKGIPADEVMRRLLADADDDG